MELTMGNIENSQNVVDIKKVIADANNPQIRIFLVEKKSTFVPLSDVAGGQWRVCSPDAVRGSSAVAYFFGQALQDKLKRPIGLIDTYWGGQPVQTFTGTEALQALPFEADALKNTANRAAPFLAMTPDQQKAAMADYQTKVTAWQQTSDGPYNDQVRKWQADVAAAKAANQPEPPRPTESQPRPQSPDGREGEPGTLFNGMIHPLIPYAIKGALWYQGESNGGNGPDADQYGPLLETMISDWRTRWNEPEFPFLVVGLANFGYRYPDPVDEGWAHVRNGEIEASTKLKNVAVAEAIDIGEAHNIHPVDKLDVGRRLAAAALHIAYGRKGAWVGPTFESMKAGAGKIRVKFAHTGGGLKIGVSPHTDEPLPTDKLVGFAIAGDDKKWAWADAKISGDDVILTSTAVPNPVAVRYGWANNPAVNLYNAEGFPAEPFRTDNWPFVNPPPAPQKW
jgi:sialate O-acetylesterase